MLFILKWLLGSCQFVGGGALGKEKEMQMLKIATAVLKAEGKTRFFRKFDHWMFAFQRYAPAAIAAEQWSAVAILNPIDTVCHLAERENAKNPRMGTAISLHYEALVWRSLDSRCRNSDLEITGLSKIKEIVLKVDEHILEIARTKIMAILQKAGLSVDIVAQQGGHVPRIAEAGTEFESAMAKQEASAAQLRKSAEEVRKKAQREKEEADRARRQSNGDFRNSKERRQESSS